MSNYININATREAVREADKIKHSSGNIVINRNIAKIVKKSTNTVKK